MTRRSPEALLLGEWACLGILYAGPAHGFAIAGRLAPDADIGRIWSLSRALTYRSLEQLTRRGLIEPVGEEPGIAGGNRTILAATRRGRDQLRRWLDTPVEHLRDLRSELLLKIVLAAENGIDITDTLGRQRQQIAGFLDDLDENETPDIVHRWRHEYALAALRFLDQIIIDSTSRRRSGDAPRASSASASRTTSRAPSARRATTSG